MEVKEFKGKAIYNPSGKAGEYSYWACNFYVGCSNGCTYCYLKKGRGAAVLGGSEPKLKACFKDEAHAMKVFEKELNSNLPELQKNGLFFTFTSDPMLQETIDLTIKAIDICTTNGVPVKVLTKVDFTDETKKIGLNQFCFPFLVKYKYREIIAFGFTLTGHDELEPGASTNQERIEAMRELHEAGFKTFASIEPVIDLESSLKMIEATKDFCDLYKIGLESGKKFDKTDVRSFISMVVVEIALNSKIYFKDSLLKAAGINREDLPSNCVYRDYNIFNH